MHIFQEEIQQKEKELERDAERALNEQKASLEEAAKLRVVEAVSAAESKARETARGTLLAYARRKAKDAKQLVKDILGDKYDAFTHTCSADATDIISNSIDIIIESDGFHHCPSLSKVIRESNRILKSNGFLLGIDRIHENYVTDKEIHELLDVEYSIEWLKKNNYKVNKLTRRENGEGEIRFSEWQESLLSNNFQDPLLTQYIKRTKSSLKGWIISNMPIFLITILYNLKQSNKGFHKNPRWSINLLPTLIFGFNISFSLKSHKLFIRTFPKSVNTTLVRKQVLLSRSK